MIKKVFRCNNCKKDFCLYLKRNDTSLCICTNCGNPDGNIEIYFPVYIDSKENQVTSVGEETVKVIEENSQILGDMKKEIMKWN